MNPFSLLSKCKVPVVLYHMVNDECLPHLKYLYSYRSVALFEKDLDFLTRNFNFISLDLLLKHLDGNEKLPERPMLLTFDDGFREMHEIVMPVLLKKGIPATFFLISNPLDNKFLPYRNKISLLVYELMKPGNAKLKKIISPLLSQHGLESGDIKKDILSLKYNHNDLLEKLAAVAGLDFNDFLIKRKPFLDTDQVKDMIHKGFTTGAHSVDHPNFTELDTEEKFRQIADSISFLEERKILTHKAFAFPFHSNMISGEFYREIISRGVLEIMMGTNGIVRNNQPRHFQRFHLDFGSGSVQKILAGYYMKGILKDHLNLKK